MCYGKVLPDSMACRLYVLAVLIETTVNLAIEGDLFLRIREMTKDLPKDSESLASRRMPVYLSVFAIAQWVLLSATFSYSVLRTRSSACFNLSWL